MRTSFLARWVTPVVVASALPAWADVSLDIRDTDGDPHRAYVTTAQPSFTFDAVLNILGQEEIAGADFFVRSKDSVGQNVSNLFKITSRSILAPGIDDGLTYILIILPPNDVLKPNNPLALGFAMADPFSGPAYIGDDGSHTVHNPGSHPLERLTLQYLGAAAAPGTSWQIVLSSGSITMGWNDPTGAAVFPFASQTNDLPGWQTAGTPFIVEYAPEPEGSLCVLVAASLLGSCRARRKEREVRSLLL